jgi:hypothetical protein
MMKKNIIFFVLFAFVTAQPLTVFAGQAVLLNDTELDQVYAGGLNLNFDTFFGSMDSIATDLTKSGIGQTTLNNKPITVVPVQSVGKLIASPVSPMQTATPADVQKAIDASAPTVPAVPVTVQNDSGITAQPLSVEPNLSVLPVQNSQIEEVSLTDMQLRLSSSVPVSDTAVVSVTDNSYVPLSDQADAVITNTDPVQTDALDLTDSALTYLTNGSEPPANNTALAPVESPLKVESPSSTTSPIGVTGVTTSDGRIGVLAFESIGEIVPTNVESMTMNSINVSDTAQQYLSAMNNVNAAGSTVLIQQNLVILINSTVENLNNSNALDMSSLIPLQ